MESLCHRNKIFNMVKSKKMKKEKNRVLIVLFVLGLTLQLNISTAQTSLDDLLGYALEHSREIKKAGLQTEEAGYKRKEVLGQGLPQAEATGTYTKMMIDEIEISESMYAMVPEQYAPILDQIAGIDALYTASAGVQVTQLIYSQAWLVGLKTTKKAQELYEILENKTEDEVIEEVANSYYQTYSLILQLNTLENSLNNLNEIYKIVELSYENDFVKESDVDRLKVTITNLEVNQQTIENVIDIQLNYLKALAGLPVDTILAIDTTIIYNTANAIGLDTAFTVEDVPAYQLLLKQCELNDQQVKLAKANYYPTLAAFGKFNYSSYNIEPEIESWHNMNTIGVQLSIPLFTSGTNNAKVKQAQLQKAQAEETLLQTKDLLAIGYNSALSEYQTAWEMLEVQLENRSLAQKVYRQTTLLYKEGMASMADVLNVNSDFLQADNSYNQQLLKCRLAEVKMLKSTGNLKQLMNNEQ